MSTVVWHELGTVAGVCTVCGADGALSIGEARFQRNLMERVRREHESPPARFVTCADCGWRWSVRAGDTSASGVGRRSAAPSEDAVRDTDEPVTATRTVLPQPRDSRRVGRDWVYPSA